MVYAVFLASFLPHTCAISNTFSFLSANLNGFGNVNKLNLVANIILNHCPLAAVLTETKCASPMVQMLHLPGYNLYGNPGIPASHTYGGQVGYCGCPLERPTT